MIKNKDKIIGDRHKFFDIANEKQYDSIIRICKALSTKERLDIVRLLRTESMSIVEIANKLNIAVSSTAFHVKCLEDADIIITETKPGMRGSMRLCSHNFEKIEMELLSDYIKVSEKNISINMPIGLFYNIDVYPTCGMADENGNIIVAYDNPKIFYDPKRVNAQLIWFHKGYIEYRFPNKDLIDINIKNISFSVELCSEAPGYMQEWPSDISIIVNNKLIGVYRSNGDFGERRGVLTPKNWSSYSTQYGILKTFSISKDGTFIDGVLFNKDVNIENININGGYYISFIIAVNENSKYVGGVNIFGEKFGDYSQDIIMRVHY